jgi:hypothetical protein
MRVIITSPPKMGNQWIKCLLCHVYDLKLIGGQDSPDTNIQQFEQFVQQGRFPDSTIFHQHCRYKPPLCDVMDEIPVHLVTIVRDPYDAFVSSAPSRLNCGVLVDAVGSAGSRHPSWIGDPACARRSMPWR